MDSATEPAPAVPRRRIVYNAFLSYSHVADGNLAAALQKALHRFAKQPFRLRAVRVFCDSASLGANPALWPAIEDALAGSEYLILMASPHAAASPWVAKEIDYWKRNKSTVKILIALTAGEIAWDEQTHDFDWTKTTALPTQLSGAFEQEPLWVDLRWASQASDSSLAHPHFRDCVADLAAPLHARAKDDLIGEDLRQARRMRRLTLTAIVLLTSLAVALGWMSVEAERRRQMAATQRDRALKSQSRYLADAALRQVAAGEPEVGVLLALEALPKADRERPYVAEAEAALHVTLGTLGVRKIAELTGQRTPAGSARFSPDGKRVVTVGADATPLVWDADSGMRVSMLTGHEKPVWFATYLPDGSGISTASVDGTARLWEAATGKQVRVFQGHQGPVLHAAVSSDGRLLATASADSTARVWRIDNGSMLTTLRGHSQALCCIQISPDGSRVATASVDGTARLWDVRSGKTVAVFKGTPRALSTPAGQPVVVKFSADGKLIATSHEDNTVRLWNASYGSPVAVLKGHSGAIKDGAFSNDSRFFVTASADGTARLWKLDWRNEELAAVSAGRELHQKQEGEPSELEAAVFGPEGDYAVTAGQNSMQFWDPATGAELAIQHLEDPARGIVMSRDGRRLATLHLGRVVLWQVTGGSLTRWRFQEQREPVQRADRGLLRVVNAALPGLTWNDQRWWEPPVAMTNDGKTIVSVTGRGFVLRNGETGRGIAAVAAHSRVVTRAVFNAAGDRMLSTSDDGSAKLWDTRSGALLETLSGHDEPVLDGAFSPAGDVVATASEDRTLRLWDAKGAPESVLRGHQAAIRQLAFSGDGKRIVTVSDDRTARVWDVASGGELSTLVGGQGGFGFAALNRAGDRAATAGTGNDHTVTLWEAAGGRELHRWQESQGTVMGLAFSLDGQTVLTWGADGWARLWNVQGRYDRLAMVGYGCAGPGSIEHAHLSDDGERIVTVLRNGRADVWDKRSGTALLNLHTFAETRNAPPCEILGPPTAPEVASVASSPDLRQVLVDGENGALVLFAIASRAEAIRRARQLVSRSLTTEERQRFFLAE